MSFSIFTPQDGGTGLTQGAPVARPKLLSDLHDFLTRCGSLPDNLSKLRACEQQFAALAPLITAGTTATLAGGILLALNREQKLFLAEVDANGKSLAKNAGAYETRLIQEFGLARSKSSLSKNRRGGHIYLELLRRDLPTPHAAEPLIQLLRVHPDDAKAAADAIAELAQGARTFPPPWGISDYVEKHAPKCSGAKAPKLDPQEVIGTCERALRVITGQDAEALAARDDLNRLLVQSRKQKTQQEGQEKKNADKKSAKQAPRKKHQKDAPAETPGAQEKPHLPHVKPTSASAGIVLVERHGAELRATLTARNDGMFAAYKAYLQTRKIAQIPWRFAEGIHCDGHPKGKGVDRCEFATEAEALTEMSALVEWARREQNLEGDHAVA